MKHYHLLMILILLSGCAGNIQKDNGKEEYFVFFSSKYMKLNESHSYATYPWIIEEFERNKDNTLETNEILVTHSCGLFEVEIEGIWLRDLGKDLQWADFTSINAYYPGGEFCNISHLISIQPKLLSVKKWNGELFIQDYWELKYIADYRLAILGHSKAHDLGIAHLLKDIPKNNHSEACESDDFISPYKVKQMLKERYITHEDGEVCFTKGVYLDEIIKNKEE